MKSDEFEKIRDFSVSSHAISPLSGWQAAHELGFAVALWQLPRKKDKQLIINFSAEIVKTKIVLEDLPAGFAISPFLNIEGNDSLFIEADLYFRFNAVGEVLTEKSGTGISTAKREQWEKHCGTVVPTVNIPQKKPVVNNYKKYLWWFFPWAAVVSYSRIYVGVHYPFDVLVGALIGCVAAYLSVWAIQKLISLRRY